MTQIAAKRPAGIPYIIGNEAAERFSYYGMRCILVVYMTRYLLDASGQPDYMSEESAKAWFHLFVMANYLFPLLGALISDVYWGKYLTILRLSIVYCLGHGVLALWETTTGLATGLMLIAIGSGGIKPCVSAHVGDQFNSRNAHLIEPVFSMFYFSINLGAFISTLLIPSLLETYGPSVAFGVPGLFMLTATWIFWLGRTKFISIPPVKPAHYFQQLLHPGMRRQLGFLGLIYLHLSVFWSLFDQMGSSWVLQAERMNRNVNLNVLGSNIEWLRFELLPSQLQALNPILILLLIPVFISCIYPALNRVIQLSYMRKIFFGMLLGSSSFIVIGLAEARIIANGEVSILWQCWAFLLLTAGEVMVSITALELSYTQAPHQMKSFIMGLFLLSISLGNGIAALVNILIMQEASSFKLDGAMYFYFFAGLLFVTALSFYLISRNYQEERLLHEGAA